MQGITEGKEYMILSVFTPTYNRSKCLKRSYESLCNQTYKDFIWIIVDDGSSDDTELIVKSWINDKVIQIVYIKEDNHGKAYAHNMGVKACKTEAFVCLDSDDYLVNDAIERIVEKWELISERNDVAGIISPRLMNGTTLFSARVPEYGTIQDLYDKYGFRGETLIVFKTNILRDNMFPTFENEKFVKEAIVYLRIDAEYEFLYYNHFLSCGDYLNDGLSSIGKSREMSNPRATLEYYKTGAIYRKSIIQRAKSAGCYYAWKEKFCLVDKTEDLLPISSKFAGMILHMHYKRIFDHTYK